MLDDQRVGEIIHSWNIFRCQLSLPECILPGRTSSSKMRNRKPKVLTIWVKIPQNEGILTGGPFIFLAELPMFIKFEATQTRNPHRSNL